MTTARILVVDDAATVRLYHRKMLTDAGWRTDEAANGVEAMEKVLGLPDGETYDLFVVDINMPKLDGYGFVRGLRRDDRVPQVPVLMISTEAQAHDAATAHEAGANAYLLKPARPADLVITAGLLLGDLPAARRAARALGVGARP
jgi:two-component system chemotaxis response regulator CheY